MNNNNLDKFYLKVLLVGVIVGVLAFFITYNVWNVHMDKKIDKAFANQVKTEAQVVDITDIEYKGEKYSSLKEVEGKLSNGDTLAIKVKYENKKTKDKKAYVVTAKSNSIKEVIYSDVPDSNVGQIILPKGWKNNKVNTTTGTAIKKADNKKKH